MLAILSIGADKSLLYTRRLILEKSGASVRSVSPEQALLLISNSSFDLLVLCHSVKDDEVDQLCAVARASTPAIKTLLIDTPTERYRPHFDVDCRFSLDEGPAVLVWTVRRLLHGAEPDLLDEAPGRLVPFVRSTDPEGKELARLKVPHSITRISSRPPSAS